MAMGFLEGARSTVQDNHFTLQQTRQNALTDRKVALFHRQAAWATLRDKKLQLYTSLQRKSPAQLYQEMQQAEKLKETTQKILEARQKLLEERIQLQTRLFQEMLEKTAADLVEDLRSEDPLTRFLAVQAAGKRRLHMEQTLIGMLADPVPEVRQAARYALGRLGRGTDFGPHPAAGATQVALAQDAWREWLLMQGAPVLADEPPATETTPRPSKSLSENP
jgi:HEAT repeat protein